MIKISRAGSCGNHHKRGRYRTSKSIGRLVNNAKAVASGLSCNERRGSTTIEVNRVYTSRFEQNLCDFRHVTTAREGLLASIENHKYNLTGSCNTYCSSGSTRSTSISCNDLTVFNKSCAKSCDTLLNTILVNRIVFLSSSNNSSTVIENTEETVGVRSMIFSTIHHKKTTRLTCGHIKSCSVDTCNYIIVRNVIRTVGITILILSGIRLIKDSGHFPTKRRIIMRIVCINIYVISCNITCCEIVNHLLAICRCSIMNFLCNTRGKLYGRRRECAEVGILMIIYIVAGKLAEIISKCITYCLSVSDKILRTRKISCSLQSRNKLIRKILVIYCISYLRTCAVCAKSISHKVSCTVLIGKIFSHIVQENFSERILVFSITDSVLYGLEDIHNIECIKVSVIVLTAERRKCAWETLLKEKFLANLGNHIFKKNRVKTESGNYFKKVNKVACPTGNVSMVEAELVVVSNIHRTEDMSDIRLITIRKLEVRKILQSCNCKILLLVSTKEDLSIDHVFHVGYKLCKICILVTCHNTPRTGVITLNAGTDIFNYKIYRIL